MTRYTHDFDCRASITNYIEDFNAVPPELLRQAMLDRIHKLQPDEICEAFGHVQTEKEPDAPEGAKIRGDAEHIVAVKIRELYEDPRKAALLVIRLEALERLIHQVRAHLTDKPGCWNRKELLALITTL